MPVARRKALYVLPDELGPISPISSGTLSRTAGLATKTRCILTSLERVLARWQIKLFPLALALLGAALAHFPHQALLWHVLRALRAAGTAPDGFGLARRLGLAFFDFPLDPAISKKTGMLCCDDARRIAGEAIGPETLGP